MNTLRLEDEQAMLHELVNSAGWKLFHAKWSKLLKDCNNSLRAQDCPNREWYAGLVVGYERVLDYPGTRIETIDKLILERDKKSRET